MIRFILAASLVASLAAVIGLAKVDAGVRETFAPAHRPAVKILNSYQHVHINGTVPFCGQVFDRDGDRLRVWWSASRKGGGFSQKTQVGRRHCATYRAPQTPGWLVVRLSASDGINRSVARTGFCVLFDNFEGSAPSPGNDCYGTR